MATENDSVSTDAIGTLVIVLSVAVVAVGLAVTAMVRAEQNALAASRETQANLRPLRELRASQLADLTASPAWVNREKNLVTIPIDRAMELVLEQVRTDPKVTPPTVESAPGVNAQPNSTVPAVDSASPGDQLPKAANAHRATLPATDHAH